MRFILIFFVACMLLSCENQEVIHKKVAFIGRYNDLEGRSGSNEWYDGFVESSLRYFIDKMNRENAQVKITLETFNIHQDPAKSDSVYSLIANDPDYIWVLDNSWGHDMVGARETIIKNKIPVMSINAYKGYNEYGPGTLFLLDYERDIFYITAFAKKILHRDTIDFISERDVVFHDHFLDSFQKFDLVPSDTITYVGQQNINKKDSIELFSQMYEHFVGEGRTKNRVVLYNSHFMWGNAVVEFLNNHLTNSKFMSWSVPQKEYVNALKNGNQIIQHHRSHFSVSEPVFTSYRQLLKKDYEHFKWDGAASLMEDLRNTVDILDKFIKSQNDHTELTAAEMWMYLTQLREEVTVSKNNIYRFTEEGKMIREKTFTVYDGKGIAYYPFQINQQYEVVPALNMGIDLHTIHDINLSANAFKANFEFWITGDSTYKNSDDYVRIKNMQLDESVVELLHEKYIAGQFLKRYSVAGTFNNTYAANDYPFDIQELQVEIELLNPTNELRITIDPATFDEKIDDLKINSWKSNDYYVTVDQNIYKENLINQYEYASNEVINIHFFTKRNVWSSMLQIVLPLFFIGAISIGILYLKNLHFSELGEVIVGLFLSIIAFSISLAQLTPKFEDLTKADQLFLLTFVIVFFIFIYLILLNSKVRDKVSGSVPYLRLALSVLYPCIFVFIVLL